MATKSKGKPIPQATTSKGPKPPAKSAAKPSDLLKIAVTFKRGEDGLGLTRLAARPGTDVLRGFQPDSQALGLAMQALEAAGFSVSSTGRLSLSVRGKRADFEKVFGTRLAARAVATEMGRSAVSSFLAPPDEAPWSPDPALAALIDDAYIQWPHLYLNQRFPATGPSPLPPRVDYHHLRVPGDVAMAINASRVHRQGTTGQGVRVAMIDSGFAHGHPYFVEHGYNSSVALAAGASHPGRDGNGHGTGESANVFAIAPDATFIGIKLDNEDSPASGASVLEGFQEALRHDPQVISVSLGYDLCPSDPATGRRTSNQHLTQLPNSLKALEAEIRAAVEDGVVVVFSAGNGHVAFPGMLPEVISAGGVFVAENGRMEASDYASAFTSRVYPGRRVPDFCGLVGLVANNADYVMLPIEAGCEIDRDNSAHDGTGNRDGWGVFSGTSAAAPQLAGVCALLLERNPGLTPADVKGILSRTSRDVIHGRSSAASNVGVAISAAGGTDRATGAGLVDAFAAWQQA